MLWSTLAKWRPLLRNPLSSQGLNQFPCVSLRMSLAIAFFRGIGARKHLLFSHSRNTNKQSSISQKRVRISMENPFR